MTVVVKTGKLVRFFSTLPKKIKEEVEIKASRTIALSGQQRIKRRYDSLGYGTSQSSTGAGRRRISIKKTSDGYVVLVPDYIDLLDRHIMPHWLSIETIEAHRAHPGSTMFKRAPTGFKFTRPPIRFIWRGPFITPAIVALEKDVPKILEKAIAKAIQRAS